MKVKALPGPTLARVLNIDEQIAHFERQIDAGIVKDVIQVQVVLTPQPGIYKLDLLTLGMKLEDAAIMLEEAARMARELMGKPR